MGYYKPQRVRLLKDYQAQGYGDTSTLMPAGGIGEIAGEQYNPDTGEHFTVVDFINERLYGCALTEDQFTCINGKGEPIETPPEYQSAKRLAYIQQLMERKPYEE